MTTEGAPIEPRSERVDLRTRAAKGVFWTATGAWGRQLSVFLVFVILARLLEPEDFGLVALAAVFVGFTHVIAEEGLVDALVQRKELDRAHLDTAFCISMAFAVVMTAVLAGLAVPIAILLDQARLAPVLIALSLAIPIGSSSLVQRAMLTRDMAFRSLTLRTLAAIGVGSVFGVGAALMGFGVWSLVAQNLAGQITGTLVLWRVTGWRPRFEFSYPHFRDLFGFGVHVLGFRLLVYFTRRSDELFIGAFLGPVALGFYSVGYRMLRMLIQITSSLIDKVSFPLYSRLQDRPDRLRRAYYKTTSFAALIAFPMFIGILVLAPQLVSVLFGSKWEESVPVMQALTLFGIIQVLNYLNGTAIKSLGKPSWLVGIVGATAIVKVIAFLIAVPYGLVAVAIATTCVGYLVAPLYFWAVNRLAATSGREHLLHMRAPLLASALLAGTMIGLEYLLGDAPALVTLIVVSSAGAVAYYAGIRIFAPPLAGEVRDLVRRGLPTPAFARPAWLFPRR